jgi:hypothetical protein
MLLLPDQPETKIPDKRKEKTVVIGYAYLKYPIHSQNQNTEF